MTDPAARPKRVPQETHKGALERALPGGGARGHVRLPDVLEAGDDLAVGQSLAQWLLLMRAERWIGEILLAHAGQQHRDAVDVELPQIVLPDRLFTARHLPSHRSSHPL